MSRPVGVTILAILALVSGILGLFKALLWLGLGGMLAGATAMAHPIAGAFIGGVVVVFAGLAAGTGILSLIFAWGAATLRPWAWSLGVWTHGFILVWSLLAVLGPGLLVERWPEILVSGVVLLYLTSAPVRQAFGKA